MSENPEILYYRDYTDDFVSSPEQDYKLPEDYRWLHPTKAREAWADFLYWLTGILSWPYCRLVLHVRVRNRKVLRGWKRKPYYFFGNHSQALGDVFDPIHIARKRTYTICNPNNLKVPVLGRALPLIGAMPIPDGAHRMNDFMEAVSHRIAQGRSVTIYPEAHVWPYCSWIRPFPTTPFGFPIKDNVPVFTLTSTYQKRRWGKKPAITIYVDGPFYPDETLPRKQRQQKLRDQVYGQMTERAKLSTYDYVQYKPLEK